MPLDLYVKVWRLQRRRSFLFWFMFRHIAPVRRCRIRWWTCTPTGANTYDLFDCVLAQSRRVLSRLLVASGKA